MQTVDKSDFQMNDQEISSFFRNEPGVQPRYFLNARVMVSVLVYPTEMAMSFRDAFVFSMAYFASSMRI